MLFLGAAAVSLVLRYRAGGAELRRQINAAGGTSAFDAHRALGFTMAGAAVIIFVLALVARPGILPVILSGVLVAQTTLLPSLLAGLADNAALYGGLYALDGLLVLGIAGFLYATSRRRRA